MYTKYSIPFQHSLRKTRRKRFSYALWRFTEFTGSIALDNVYYAVELIAAYATHVFVTSRQSKARSATLTVAEATILRLELSLQFLNVEIHSLAAFKLRIFQKSHRKFIHSHYFFQLKR